MQQSCSCRYLQQTTPWADSTSRVESTVAVKISKHHSLPGSKHLLLSPKRLPRPLVFLEKEKPLYTTGWIVTVSIIDAYSHALGRLIKLQVVTSAICIILALIYRIICVRENKKRDNTGIAEAFENAYDDDMTDVKNKQFRYDRQPTLL